MVLLIILLPPLDVPSPRSSSLSSLAFLRSLGTEPWDARREAPRQGIQSVNLARGLVALLRSARVNLARRLKPFFRC